MSTSQAYAATPVGGSGSDEVNRLNFVIGAMINKMVTMTIVSVQAIGNGTVDIMPLVDQIDGAGNGIGHGIIHNVPVIRLQGGSGAVILDPVVGDNGVALFSHSDISKVKATKKRALPGSRRKFDWSDALYLGGVLNPNPVQSIRIAGDGVTITSPMVQTTGNFTAGTGATGSFSTPAGQTVTVVGGIITGIV